MFEVFQISAALTRHISENTIDEIKNTIQYIIQEEHSWHSVRSR